MGMMQSAQEMACASRGRQSALWMVPLPALAIALLATCLAASPAIAQPAPVRPGALPFAEGEELTYQVRLGRFGQRGQGTMTIEDGAMVRGRDTYLLSFDFASRVGPFTISDRARSWLDPERMTTMRYEKHESSPVSSRHEDVDTYPAEDRWASEQGATGVLTTENPLDELSFLYYIRTLELEPGAEYEVARHFDAARNPVVIRVIGREMIEVPAGEFETIVVEMRVKDAGRFGGTGVLRLYLWDHGCRVPVQIESSMPVVGSVVLSLVSRT
ncbi:MAG: DUF3108 domain-containing protein [Gemmatimonadota bacterium]